MSSIKFSGLASGLDTENIVKELMKAERMKVDKVKKQKTKLEWKKEIWEDTNKKIYDFYKTQVFALKMSSTFMKKTASSSQDSAVSVKATVTAMRGTHTINITKLAKGSFLTGSQLDEDLNNNEVTSSTIAKDLVDFNGKTSLTIKVKGQASASFVYVTINDTDTIAAITQKINDADSSIKASFDDNFKRIFISSKETGVDQKVEFDSTVGADEQNLLVALGFGAGNLVGTAGQDAAFNYNGEDFTSSKNTVQINGLELTFKSVTTGDTNIVVTQDTDEIYKKIKDFILKYNELVTEINEKVNAKSAKGYEPLTDEQKKSMSEEDIKLWEKKVKDSLLRRDSILTSLGSSMRSILTMNTGVDTSSLPDGYKYLSDLGIVTSSNYKEGGLLHIQGDEDDVEYGMNENKLKKAIEDDPDKVSQLLNSVGQELYDTMQDKMKSTTISSAMTFFDDKQMNDQIKDYEDRVSDLEEKMTGIEDRYYKQFTAMEQAIQQMNNQSSYLTSMLGGGK